MNLTSDQVSLTPERKSINQTRYSRARNLPIIQATASDV
jgi:hypothetical protein